MQADGTAGCSPFLYGQGPFWWKSNADNPPGEQFVVGVYGLLDWKGTPCLAGFLNVHGSYVSRKDRHGPAASCPWETEPPSSEDSSPSHWDRRDY